MRCLRGRRRAVSTTLTGTGAADAADRFKEHQRGIPLRDGNMQRAPKPVRPSQPRNGSARKRCAGNRSGRSRFGGKRLDRGRRSREREQELSGNRPSGSRLSGSRICRFSGSRLSESRLSGSRLSGSKLAGREQAQREQAQREQPRRDTEEDMPIQDRDYYREHRRRGGVLVRRQRSAVRRLLRPQCISETAVPPVAEDGAGSSQG